MKKTITERSKSSRKNERAATMAAPQEEYREIEELYEFL
jgi:hypothetical protein